MMKTRQAQVLLVDDDLMDVKAVKRAFAKAEITNPVTVAKDGVEALEILRGEGGRAPLARPYLILLDLNMPRMNGLEFLGALRANAVLRGAVVFALTTSGHDQDRRECYEHNVAGYLVKSRLGKGFGALTTLLEAYFRLVDFP